MFGDTGPLFTSDAFSRVFPPKLRQAVAGTMEDIISSFKDERLQNVCKKLMPAHSEGKAFHFQYRGSYTSGHFI